jgi:hypothetical protein
MMTAGPATHSEELMNPDDERNKYREEAEGLSDEQLEAQLASGTGEINGWQREAMLALGVKRLGPLVKTRESEWEKSAKRSEYRDGLTWGRNLVANEATPDDLLRFERATRGPEGLRLLADGLQPDDRDGIRGVVTRHLASIIDAIGA